MRERESESRLTEKTARLFCWLWMWGGRATRRLAENPARLFCWLWMCVSRAHLALFTSIDLHLYNFKVFSNH